MWFWIVICLFVPVSDTQRYYSTGNTTYCYDNPPPNYRPPPPVPFCVECGCFETGLTVHTLRCGEYEAIRMESYKNPIEYGPYNHSTSRSCILIRDRDDYCYSGFSGNLKTAERIEIYRNCTLQNNCTVTASPVEEGNVKLIRYPYVCERNIQDISKPFTGELSNPVFYFKGVDYINNTIDCDCSVYKSSGNIEVEMFYIHGNNICNKLAILPDTDLIKCTVDDIQLYTAQENIQSKFLKIVIRNMTVTGDEVVFFKVHGNDLNVTCTGCITRPESVATPSTTTLSTPILPQQTTSTNLNSGRSSSTKPESTSGQTSSNLNLNEADFISRTEHEKKLNQTYAMFGGIIAGIIILVLLGFGTYCFVRKRRKVAKVKKENQQPMSPQDNNGGEYTHYNYVDLDVPKETETSNKETETSKLNKSSGQSTNPQPAQQIRAVQRPNENNKEITSTVSPNLYYELDFESENTKKSDALHRPEEKKQTNEVYNEPKKFYAEKQKAVTKEQKAVTQEQKAVTQEQKAVTQEQKVAKSKPNIVSNTDDPVEDTYNHIGDTNKLTPKAVTQEQKAVTQEQKAVTQEQKAVTQEQKAVTQEPKAVTQEPKGAKSIPNIVSNTDDPVEDTYNHIGDTNKLMPKAVTQEQKAVTQEQEAVTQEQKAVTQEQKAVTQEQKAVTQEQKAVTQEQKGANSIPNIVSNTDEPAEDTYNHIGDTNKLMPEAVAQGQKAVTQEQNTDDPVDNDIGDTNKPITGRIKVLPKKYIKPIARLKPIQYNQNSTDSVPTTVVALNPNQPDNLNNPTDKPKPVRYNHYPTDSVPTTVVTLNPNQPENLINRQIKPNPSKDDYSHVNVKTQQFPKPSQTNYDHIDDRLVIMDSPVDRENTYSHIANLPKEKTPQPSPRMRDKVLQSDDSPTAEDFYENVQFDQEVKADNSVEAASLYNDEIEDTYNHLENTDIVNL